MALCARDVGVPSAQAGNVGGAEHGSERKQKRRGVWVCWHVVLTPPLTMPRSQDAKQWQPDAFEQDMIDQIANYAIIAERCSAHLRSLDIPAVNCLWSQVQADFLADPVKYPSALAQQNDIEGRRQFQLKCKAICFPPKSAPPSTSPEE